MNDLTDLVRSRIDRKPLVLCVENESNQLIVKSLPQLHQEFTPTPWLFNTHAQVIFHGIRDELPGPRQRALALYEHQDTLTMRDGGKTALFWCGYTLPESTPTLLVLHTIAGSPENSAELVANLREATGWRVVLCLRRGHGELPLVTPRMNILGCTDDLREQLAFIRERFRNSPLYCVGTSAGSGLLARYLGEEGAQAPFKAAFAYCPGYDTDTGFEKAHPFYSRKMAKKLSRQFIEPNLEIIGHLTTTETLRKARDLAEYHRFAYELAGHDSFTAYAQASNPMRVFEQIKIPVMMLNSEDDPICRIGNLNPWLPAIRTMDNVILVTTADGSHCAHYESWTARSWSARLMADYFKVIEGSL